MPLSRMVTRTVSVSSLVSTAFFGIPTTDTGMANSRSYTSLSVVCSQKMPESARKNTKISSSLLVLLKRSLCRNRAMLPRNFLVYLLCRVLAISL